jgi:hypothetical protein
MSKGHSLPHDMDVTPFEKLHKATYPVDHPVCVAQELASDTECAGQPWPACSCKAPPCPGPQSAAAPHVAGYRPRSGKPHIQ